MRWGLVLILLGSMGGGGVVLLRLLGSRLTRLERAAYGAPLGVVLGSLALLGLASLAGHLSWSMIAGVGLAGLAVVVAGGRSRRRAAAPPAAPAHGLLVPLVLGAFFARWMLLWSDAFTMTPSGLSTGTVNLYGDWALHLGDVASFAYGDNFPPLHPRYLDLGYSYHYLTSVTVAALVKLGVDPVRALPFHSFVFSILLALGLYAFCLRLTRSSSSAVLALVLFLLGGGLGWWESAAEAARSHDLGALTDLSEASWQRSANLHWMNVYFTLIVPQRGYLYGLPLGLLILTLLLEAVDGRDVRVFVAAGAVAGLLPTAHLSTLLALALITPFLVLLYPARGWVVFFGVWIAVAVPQLYFQQSGGAGPLAAVRLQPGWVAGPDPWPWFWLKNLGCFLPLYLLALADRTLLPPLGRRFLWAFLPVFAVANLVVFQPWDWDNTKVLIYWYLGACVLVGAFLTGVWRESGTAMRLVVGGTVATMILSGLLVNLRQAQGKDRQQLLSVDDVQLAARVRAVTPPRSRFAVGLQHNHPISVLGGRQILMGYPGWLWTLGIDYGAREADLRTILSLAPDAERLLRTYRIDYVVIGPNELEQLGANLSAYRARFRRLLQTPRYEIFDVSAGPRLPGSH